METLDGLGLLLQLLGEVSDEGVSLGQHPFLGLDLLLSRPDGLVLLLDEAILLLQLLLQQRQLGAARLGRRRLLALTFIALSLQRTELID